MEGATEYLRRALRKGDIRLIGKWQAAVKACEARLAGDAKEETRWFGDGECLLMGSVTTTLIVIS